MTDHGTAADTTTVQARDRRERRLVWAVVVWIPFAIVAVTTLVQLLWIPRMPDEIAVHFDATGQPDRWTTPGRAVLGSAVISLSLVLALAIATFGGARAMRQGEGRPVRYLARVRPTAVFAPATTVAVSGIMLALYGLQLEGVEAPAWSVPVAIIGGLLLGALVGWIAWRVLPAPDRSASDAPAATPALDLAPGERAVWTETSSSPWLVAFLIGLALAVTAVPLVLAPEAWWLWVLLFVFVLLLATTAWIRVTVDRNGLVVRTLLGFPLSHVPLDRVISAADVDVLPAEFGGWGFRFDMHGRRGIIIRSGEAIEVERTGAAPLVVTVADARTGAALLNALAAAKR
ncbi:DUF1648 domain-containing protein [Agromyces allii]|uniref:DUF1648 domain-containing protein n=1 Tax=Agromyces allii TaxID=393607 RepID=A0ABP5CBN2_9MICO|nr:DUF1648 domain-containing protein [Agromyces allii]